MEKVEVIYKWDYLDDLFVWAIALRGMHESLIFSRLPETGYELEVVVEQHL
jgi:hypothetical protein